MEFTNKNEILDHIEVLMEKALAEGRIEHNPAVVRQVTLKYHTCLLSINTTFDCLERTFRRIRSPHVNGKIKSGKRLQTAVTKFENRL